MKRISFFRSHLALSTLHVVIVWDANKKLFGKQKYNLRAARQKKHNKLVLQKQIIYRIFRRALKLVLKISWSLLLAIELRDFGKRVSINQINFGIDLRHMI
jgi:hypothetical protein